MNIISYSNFKKTFNGIFKDYILIGIFILFTISYSSNVLAQHQEYFPDPNPAIQKKLEKWQDLKFGLLMHWGTYSQWGIVESWSHLS